MSPRATSSWPCDSATTTGVAHGQASGSGHESATADMCADGHVQASVEIRRLGYLSSSEEGSDMESARQSRPSSSVLSRMNKKRSQAGEK